MKQAMATTTSRTVWFSRLVLALTVALVLGTMVVPEVGATKNNKNTVKSVKVRLGAFRDMCEAGGGTMTVTKRPGGTTATCTGGSGPDYTCTFHSKGARCHRTRTLPPSSPVQDVTSPPTEGVNEDPTGGSGGTNAGGGVVAPPPTEADTDGGEPEQPILQ